MKRLFFIAVIFLLLASLIRCSSGQEEGEAAITERNNIQLAVVDAWTDIFGNVDLLLTPGCITNAPFNNVTYGNGSTILPIGDYIKGGLESLTYTYYVYSDGAVIPTTGPLA